MTIVLDAMAKYWVYVMAIVLGAMVTYWQRGHLKVLCTQCRSCKRRRSEGMTLPQCEHRWCPGGRGSDSEGVPVGGSPLETTPLRVWPEGEEEPSDPEEGRSERIGGEREGDREEGVVNTGYP